MNGNGNGRYLWSVIRWVLGGISIAACYFGLKAEIASNHAATERRLDAIDHRLRLEFLTREGFRVWATDLALYNTRSDIPDASAANTGAQR